MDDPRYWTCPICTAACNFEAMEMCQLQGDCPAMHVPHMGFNFYQPSAEGRWALLQDWTNPLLDKMNLDWGDYDMPYRITKEFSIDFGHRVWTQKLDAKLSESQPCKCRHLHGHTGRIVVDLKAAELDKGMVTDFAHLNWFKSWLDDHFDHKSIFDISDPLLGFMFGGFYPAPTLDDHTYWQVVRYPLGGAHFCVPHPVAVARESARWDLDPEAANALSEAILGLVAVNFVPTSENLARFFYDTLRYKLVELEPRVVVEQVTFCETPKTSSVYYVGE